MSSITISKKADATVAIHPRDIGMGETKVNCFACGAVPGKRLHMSAFIEARSGADIVKLFNGRAWLDDSARNTLGLQVDISACQGHTANLANLYSLIVGSGETVNSGIVARAISEKKFCVLNSSGDSREDSLSLAIWAAFSTEEEAREAIAKRNRPVASADAYRTFIMTTEGTLTPISK